jgi:hypothetical protein
MATSPQATDVLVMEPESVDCSGFLNLDRHINHEGQDAMTSNAPSASTKRDNPSLKVVLLAYRDLLLAGKLHFTTQKEWDAELEKDRQRSTTKKRHGSASVKRTLD